MTGTSVHASAVKVGDAAVLIRGPSGAGKSRLAFALMVAGRARQIPATVLIGDDRVDLSEQDGRLIVRGVPALAGLIEIRGLGIRRCDHAPGGPVGLVVDLAASDGARLPDDEAMSARIGDVTVPRLPVAPGYDALTLVVAALTTVAAATLRFHHVDCPQDIGNHMWPTLARL